MGDLLVFASELKALLSSGLVSSDLDHDAIDAFSGAGILPGPRTPLAAVSKLLPGHRSSMTTERSDHAILGIPAARGCVSAGCRRRTRAISLSQELDEAVRLRLMSDVPLGAMLSGGLDSSLVVALMARHMSEPVKTSPLASRKTRQGNELADARLVVAGSGNGAPRARALVRVRTPSISRSSSGTWTNRSPTSPPLGFLALSELAAQHVTVALSGQGADELLGGYRKHRAAAVVEMWNRVPCPGRNSASKLAAHGPMRLRRASRTLAAEDPIDRQVAMSGRLTSAVASRCLRSSWPLATAEKRAAPSLTA